MEGGGEESITKNNTLVHLSTPHVHMVTWSKLHVLPRTHIQVSLVPSEAHGTGNEAKCVHI